MASDIGTYGEELYEQVLPLHGPDPDGLARDYIGAVSHGAIEVDDLVRDNERGPGWGDILDPAWAPVKGLRWLAQIAGVQLRAPRIIEADRNFATAPSLEYVVDPGGGSWGSSAGPITRVVNGSAYHGTAHLHVAALIAGQSIQFTPADKMIPGREYTFSMDVLAASVAVRAYVKVFGGGGSPTQEFFGASSTGRGRRSLTFVAPSFANYMWMGVDIPATSGTDTVDVDAFMLRLGSDTSYFDGDMDGYRWEGTPGDSASLWVRLETPEEWAVYARAAIVEQSAKRRGSPGAILSAARDTLTGTKSARLLERVGGNAYRLTLVTRPSETPDPAATVAAARTQVAVGRKLTHTLTEGATIDEGTKSIDSVAVPIDSATLPDIAD